MRDRTINHLSTFPWEWPDDTPAYIYILFMWEPQTSRGKVTKISDCCRTRGVRSKSNSITQTNWSNLNPIQTAQTNHHTFTLRAVWIRIRTPLNLEAFPIWIPLRTEKFLNIYNQFVNKNMSASLVVRSHDERPRRKKYFIFL